MNLDEYFNLVKVVSSELWLLYKSKIATGERPDEWWNDTIEGFSAIAEKYRGTVAEDYAVNMAIFYMKELQRLCRMRT